MNDKSIKELSGELDSHINAKPINWPKPIDIGVAKMHIKRNLLAQIDIPMHYAGEHWITVDVFGEKEIGGKALADMYCEIRGEPVDFLPESLLQTIADEILRGDHD